MSAGKLGAFISVDADLFIRVKVKLLNYIAAMYLIAAGVLASLVAEFVYVKACGKFRPAAIGADSLSGGGRLWDDELPTVLFARCCS